MRLRYGIAGLAALALGACGQAEQGGPTPPSGQKQAGSPQTPAAQASRYAVADVEDALGCYWMISATHAVRTLEGGSATSGLREKSLWFSEAKRRAAAMGMADDDFSALMAERALVRPDPATAEANAERYAACMATLANP